MASRIGAVRGDLVGIDILERGGGRAIDELVVELPDIDLVPLLLSEIGQVDGVDVEDVRPAPEIGHDPRLDALETAAVLAEQDGRTEMLRALCARAREVFEADWTAVVSLVREGDPLATDGPAPSGGWLASFVAGSQSSEAVVAGTGGPEDVTSAVIKQAEAAIALGRSGRPFRARELRQLGALARIAGSLWSRLS